MNPAERLQALQEVQVAMRQGEFDAARTRCNQMLAANPNDLDALTLSSVLAFTTGMLDEAEQTLRRLITMRPGHAEDRFNLARVLTRQNRTDDAMREYEEAARLAPNSIVPIRGKAELLVLLGRRDEAKEFLETVIKGGLDAPEFGLILSTIDEQSEDYEGAIERARRYVAIPNASPVVSRQIFFVMGRALEKLERYDEAFSAFRRGNACAAAPFDRARFAAQIDQLVKLFSRKSLKSMAKSSIDSDQPVFITSMPRSGSTLIEQILNAHSRAVGVGEINVILEIASSATARLQTQRPYPECLEIASRKGLDRLGEAYLEAVRRQVGEADRIADKTLQTWMHAGLVQLILPQARMIHVRRHPMDTCLSCYMASLSPTAHPFTSNLEDLGFYYRGYHRLVKHWLETLNIEQMELSYEELVHNPEPTTRAIVEFCGLEWEDACLEHHKSIDRVVHTLSFDQVRKPLYTSAVERWRRYEKHLGPLRAALGDLAGE